MFSYQVEEDDLYQRADLLIQREIPQLSRGFIKKLAAESRLFFDAKAIAASYKLKHPGNLSLDYDLQALNDIPYLELDIIFEDDDLIIVNKPSGIIVHARGKYWDEASIASSLRKYCSWPSIKQPVNPADLRAGIVHRLDRGTSGVLVCAKNETSLQGLQAQFRDRDIEKLYLGITTPAAQLPLKGLIDKPVARDLHNPKKFKVSRRGKDAQTIFSIKDKYPKAYLMEIKPLTGRTHQIRLHLASLGAPILGDALYGGLPSSRLMLHAFKISFNHPVSGERLTFTAPKPPIFEEVLKQ